MIQQDVLRAGAIPLSNTIPAYADTTSTINLQDTLPLYSDIYSIPNVEENPHVCVNILPPPYIPESPPPYTQEQVSNIEVQQDSFMISSQEVRRLTFYF